MSEPTLLRRTTGRTADGLEGPGQARQGLGGGQEGRAAHQRRGGEGGRPRPGGRGPRLAKGEVGTSFLENVLPPDLAKQVTAARPENVAAREAEQAVQREAARRADLAGRATAQLQLTITGEEQGTRLGRPPGDTHRGRPGPAARPRLPGRPAAHALAHRSSLEAADPVPVGSTSCSRCRWPCPTTAACPGATTSSTSTSGASAASWSRWDPFDLYLSPDAEAGDTQWYWDGTGPAYVDVADGLDRLSTCRCSRR